MRDNHFNYEEELSEEYLSAYYQALSERVEAENSTPEVINPARVAEFARTMKLLDKYAKKNKVKVTYAMHTPLKSMGCISLVGKNISFKPDLFEIISDVATVVDIYPRTNGFIQIDFVFSELTVGL